MHVLYMDEHIDKQYVQAKLCDVHCMCIYMYILLINVFMHV